MGINLLFAAQHINTGDLLGLIRGGVIQVSAAIEDAAHHLKQAQLAYERIGDGFIYQSAERLLALAGAGFFLAGLGVYAGKYRALGRGQEVRHHIQKLGNAYAGKRGAGNHRANLAGEHTQLKAFKDFLVRERTLVKILHGQLIIGHRGSFGNLFKGKGNVVRHIGRHGNFLGQALV